MSTRVRRLVSVVLAASSAVAPVSFSPARVAAAEGGRVALAPPTIWLDTRAGAMVTGPVPVPSFGNATIIAGTADGGARVHPCGGPLGAPTVRFGAGQTIGLPLAGSTAMCLSTTAPVHLVVVGFGSVAAAPTPNDLQYVPLASPQQVWSGSLPAGSASTTTTVRLTDIPNATGAAVLLVESTSGVVGVRHRCADPSGSVSASTPGTGLNVAIARVDAPSSDICIDRYAGSAGTVTLLGHLVSQGPDPTRLPPTLGLHEETGPAPRLVPATPTRVLDTREPIGAPAAAPVAAGTSITLDLRTVVPAATTAVVLNLAVTEPVAPGFVTAYPCDAARPATANVNFVAAEVVSNLVTVKVSADRTVCLYAYARTHLVADLMATYQRSSGAGLQSVVPSRLLDTRDGTGAPAGKVGAGRVLELDVTGRGGVPDTGVTAITVNLAVTEPDASGFVTAYPCDVARPASANLNFRAGQTVPNAVTVGVSAAGTVCLYAYAATHVIADVMGWFGPANPDGFVALVPNRLLDTRDGTGAAGPGTVAAGSSSTLQVGGRGGVPASGASTVVMNVAVTERRLDGFLTLYPCDAARPGTANLNHDAGETVSNLVTVRLSATGSACTYAQRETHVIADVGGYFTSTAVTSTFFGLVG